MEGRTIYVNKSSELGNGIGIIADIDPVYAIPKGNRNLLIVDGRGEFKPDTVFYTGHCTGEAACRTLKGILGDQIKSFSAGMQILL